MKVLIRDAVRSDIHALKNKLREADCEEVLAAGNSSAEAALTHSFDRSSLCFCVEVEGSPAGLFGIVPDSLVGESANVWFLGSPEMSKIKKTFVKMSRKVIADFLVQYPRLWNVVDARYESSIQWLMSCGAVFHSDPIIMSGVPFYGFVLRRKA